MNFLVMPVGTLGINATCTCNGVKCSPNECTTQNVCLTKCTTYTTPKPRPCPPQAIIN